MAGKSLLQAGSNFLDTRRRRCTGIRNAQRLTSSGHRRRDLLQYRETT